ncbi:lymphocyte antigen 75-like [Parambassis ranga]|uniref:Lymphocyte antigen 75-like n=1 Tax=Parambassis ranga TaxID=210632 RepID=A0A6P7I4Y8_9TELE|nr:lymphocyte antigen 75-like [Parambassis ranga]
MRYYTDLATLYNESDRYLINIQNYDAWIGLTGVGSRWNWLDIYWTSWIPWGKDEPHSSDRCAFVRYDSKVVYGDSCEALHFFFCKKIGNKKEYIFIPEIKTWSEARQFCQDSYYDLACFSDSNDQDRAVVSQNFSIWIGMYRDGQTWKWSKGMSTYTKWEPGDSDSNGDCVTLSSVKEEMATQNCSDRLPFLCISDNTVVVKESKTWEEALDHCRAITTPNQPNLRYDLISVQPGAEYDYVMNKVVEANTDEVWTGLHFMAGSWLWVNGASVSYSDLPVCPSEQLRCGILSKSNTGTVATRDCTERKNFLCYSGYW